MKYDATLFKRAAAAASSKRTLSSDGSLASLDDDAAELSDLSKLSLSLPEWAGPSDHGSDVISHDDSHLHGPQSRHMHVKSWEMLKSHRTQKRHDMHATLACRARQGSVGAESRLLAM